MLRVPSIQRASIVVAIIWAAGCGDDSDETAWNQNPAPGYAGSCNFPEAATCRDYAEEQASADTPDACASAGGEWSAAQCPLAMRFGLCSSTPPATRSYAYSVEAAAALKEACMEPAKFTMLMDPPAGGTSAGTSSGAGGTTGGAGGTTGGVGGSDEDAGI